MLAVMGIVASVAFLGADQAHKPSAAAYPLDVCPVTDEKLGAMGDAVVITHEGREVRLCCRSCVGKFNKNADTYLKKMDELIIEKLGPTYPLTTCLVSGEKLESPIDFVYKNRLVRFCCKDCQKKFLASPDEYLNKLDEAKPEEKKESTGHNHVG
ncbi:MAG: hypothetical protein A2Z34_06825 [Planctomycetes bacterium RBG_16_59_8]|nr:MAG: hypothetical protein A2Z34_06825 [Planctomycetes bacterium RBG_16_59_8]